VSDHSDVCVSVARQSMFNEFLSQTGFLHSHNELEKCSAEQRRPESAESVDSERQSLTRDCYICKTRRSMARLFQLPDVLPQNLSHPIDFWKNVAWWGRVCVQTAIVGRQIRRNRHCLNLYMSTDATTTDKIDLFI
jgi:hypothetical protein